MTRQDFLNEVRRARLDGCPVTVETIIDALDRLTDRTAGSGGKTDDMAIALLRGYVPNPIRAS